MKIPFNQMHVAIKAMQRTLLAGACLLLAGSALAQTSTRTQEVLPHSPGFTLQPGKMYVVQPAAGTAEVDGYKTVTITANAGNGLNVAAKGIAQAPILFIPAGVKLEVTGAAGHGMTGGGAGIYVPSDAELIITGAGKLVATGGNAGNGDAGTNGGHGYWDKGGTPSKNNDNFSDGSDYKKIKSGAGGNGGNGGGGAGAGIGGFGGAGGVGGQGGANVGMNGSTSGTSGNNGSAGGNGTDGAAMGKVYITGAVKVTATAGEAGAAGTHGVQGWTTLSTSSLSWPWQRAGGGGAGAGGKGGVAPTAGIGGGGAGAGAGGGGGSGATGGRRIYSNAGNRDADCYGGSAVGAPEHNPRDKGSYDGAWSSVGGEGGAAGTAGTAGGEGTLYIENPSNVSGGTKNSDTAPTDMQITITFVDNEYAASRTTGGNVAKNGQVGTININIGESLTGKASVDAYKLAAIADPDGTSGEKYASDDKYFAGYYTAEGGRGTRVYKGYGTTNLEVATPMLLSGNITLYAHFTHVHHTVSWDYTYSNGTELVNGETKSAWVNIGVDQYLKYGKLTFYGQRQDNGTYPIIKTVKMQAYTNGTTNEPSKNYYYLANPSAGAENHTRAEGKIYLHAVDDPSSYQDKLSSDQNIDIYFTDEELQSFSYYEFLPCDENGYSVSNWQTITMRNEHETVYSFTGAEGDNQFLLSWEVTLTGLKVYPDHIFVKPMYNAGTAQNPNWKIISQLPVRYDGVTCPITSDPAQSSATYSGSYPVWRHDAHNVEYDNKIGLVGFTLNNHMYYMDETHGDVTQADMQSEGSLTYSTVTTPAHTLTMTVPSTSIPVLRLMPNGGTFSDTTLPIVVNETRSGKFNLSQCVVTKDGYKLSEWTTEENGSGTSYAPDCTNVPGSGAITLWAQWKENIAPVITTKEITYNEQGAIITVAVSDNVSSGEDLKVKYIVSDVEIANIETQESVAWRDATPSGVDGEYHINTYDLAVQNKSYAYIYIKATDAALNTTYKSSGRIKIDNIKPTYLIYPERNVCNFDVKVTVKDNISIKKVEYKQGTGDWTEVTATSVPVKFEAGATNTEKVYIIKKLQTQEPCSEGTHTPVELSLRITDGADNVTEYENHTHMFYDHLWDTANPKKTAVIDQQTGTYTTHVYYNCIHGCEHVWDVNAIGGEPSALYDRDSETQHYQQGLMRAETNGFFEESGTVVVTNAEGFPLAIANSVNDAIAKPEVVDGSNIILADDTNVGSATISTPLDNKKVTIDLNGHGLLVSDASGTITGNSKVTILLNDNGNTEYTNMSTVTGSPIKYTRKFSTTQQGKWQALYLPFQMAYELPDGVELGTIKSVETTATQATLTIEKGVSTRTANTSYFIRSSEASIELNSASGALEPYAAPSPADIADCAYTISGTLKNTDQVSTEQDRFWVLTNGGYFWFVASGQRQRPYRWVITPTSGSTQSIRAMVLFEDDDPDAIEAVEENATILSGEVYNLNGIRMQNINNLRPGIYVIGGKKVVVK